MKWFKRFVNDFSFDLGFFAALMALGYYTVIGSMVAQLALINRTSEFIRGSPHLAFFAFVALVLPAFVLFGLFYIHWSKNRLDSHEDVVVEELLEDKETLKKLLE